MLSDLFGKIKRSAFPINIPKFVDPILLQYNDYYRKLSPKNKIKFKRRLLIASAILDFSPNKKVQITNEMIVLITSALIQITFGLDSFKIKRFRKIIVVPSAYNFLQYRNLIGHVDFDEKCIVLSWPSVQEGFIIPDDAMNVALHEMAHAVHEEDKYRNMFSSFFDPSKMQTWESLAFKKLNIIREGKSSFLKDYAGLNMNEMFSVSVEAFFEQGLEFERRLPDLYYALVDLLGQDPLNGGMGN